MLTRTFSFSLPKGLIDEQGELHQQGTMRLATAMDEIEVQRDPRAQDSSAYGLLVMLSRVILQLGDLEEVMPEQLENLFTPDIAFLRQFYQRVNQAGVPHLGVACPQCQHTFEVEMSLPGKS